MAVQLRFCGRKSLTNNIRFFSNSANAIRYHERGNPLKVLQIEKVNLNPLSSTDVKLKALLVPINPSDINMVEGTYSLLPDLPATGGNEGVFEVIEKGSDVFNINIGDRVIPADAGLGTWCDYMSVSVDKVQTIPSILTNEQAATLAVNPCTAYRMLKDFVDLKPGDCVIQNCANSLVGESVIQFAKSFGVHTINIVRCRKEGNEALEKRLKSLGADMVITDENLSQIRKITQLPAPKLALNGTCGKIATDMTRVMESGSTMVTYGGMSKRPIMVGAAALIFKDLIFRGYWQTRWNKENGIEKRNQMFEEIAEIYQNHPFHFSFETYPFSTGLGGVEQALRGQRDGKVIFRF